VGIAAVGPVWVAVELAGCFFRRLGGGRCENTPNGGVKKSHLPRKRAVFSARDALRF